MTRRQFLASCVVLIGAWISGIGRQQLRGLLERIPQENDGLLGLLDVLQSPSIHSLSKSTWSWGVMA